MSTLVILFVGGRNSSKKRLTFFCNQRTPTSPRLISSVFFFTEPLQNDFSLTLFLIKIKKFIFQFSVPNFLQFPVHVSIEPAEIIKSVCRACRFSKCFRNRNADNHFCRCCVTIKSACSVYLRSPKIFLTSPV